MPYFPAQGLNMPDLLRIYIDFDLLEDSVILTMEYVDAVMDSFTGQDSELFNIKVSLYIGYWYNVWGHPWLNCHSSCTSELFNIKLMIKVAITFRLIKKP